MHVLTTKHLVSDKGVRLKVLVNKESGYLFLPQFIYHFSN